LLDGDNLQRLSFFLHIFSVQMLMVDSVEGRECRAAAPGPV
jgi:hypothetical protein